MRGCGGCGRRPGSDEEVVRTGPSQTEDYARAALGLDDLLTGDEQLEERVSARRGRQELADVS
ncbi:Scr1 family TA system antitoxin-like transcriptional regulator [Streptomyces althioticus]|uniref:Scr1 family TA system antitoxin-like transcriptional regulator n=1 Tax=Streptomyces althioticus TaxID=83380 RepID=UPI0036830684